MIVQALGVSSHLSMSVVIRDDIVSVLQPVAILSTKLLTFPAVASSPEEDSLPAALKLWGSVRPQPQIQSDRICMYF